MITFRCTKKVRDLLGLTDRDLDDGSEGGIARGPDGNLWFTEQQAGKIGRFLPP